MQVKQCLWLISFLANFLYATAANAEITVKDDIGQLIHLKKPAQRIISLAPHTSELLFDAGATVQVKGVVSYSDYPEQARQIARVGSYDKFDLEAIVAMQADLIVAWETGNNMSRIEEVKALGIPVFVNEPRDFEDIASTIRTLGVLMGTEAIANQRADEYKKSFEQLKQKQKNKTQVRVFYQVWDSPLFTINGQHLINQVIEFCGASNVFADIAAISPQVSIESVLEKNPEVIVAGMSRGREGWLEAWHKWTGLQAVQHRQLYAIDADLIVRHTPRILQGTERMCEILDRVREHRDSRK